MEMKLMLKNNLTQLHAIDVKGCGGTGLLEIVKVLKKVYTLPGSKHEHFINAHTLQGHIYGSNNVLSGNDIALDFRNISSST